jgi:hypothetical protein
LEVFERKSLLSAGQLAHLASASHGAIENISDYKFYFYVLNTTGRRLGEKAVKWELAAGGKEFSGHVGIMTAGQKKLVVAGASRIGIGTVTLDFEGRIIRNVDYKSSNIGEPRDIPVTRLVS